MDLGVPEATQRARDLFANTTATLVEMDLEDHDRLIAYVLGLSHALNIVFFTALTEFRFPVLPLSRELSGQGRRVIPKFRFLSLGLL